VKDLSKIAEIVSFVAVFAKSEIEKSIVEVQANLYKKLKEDLQSVTQQINEESIEAERMFKDNVALKSDVSEAQDSAVYIAKGQIDQSTKRLTRIIEDTNTFLTNSISSLSNRQIIAERALTDALQQTGLNFSDRLAVLLEDVNALSEKHSETLKEVVIDSNNALDVIHVAVLDESISRIAQLGFEFEESMSNLTYKINETIDTSMKIKTFTGEIGDTAYSVDEIVSVLKLNGLLKV